MSKRMTRYPTDRKVYVGDLGDNARKNDLEHTFGSYGKLRSVWVARNPPGFAFVEFEDARDAADAVRALDGRKLCGTRARVELSTGRISGNGRRGGGDRTRDNGRATKCYECGGRGHYARECRKWGRSRRRSYSQSRSRSDSRERKSNSRSRGSQSRSVSDPKEIQKSRDVHTSKTKRSDRSQNGETHRSGNGQPNGSRRDSLTTKRRYSDSEPSISPKRNSRSVTHRREESSYSRSRSPSTSRRN